MKKRFLLSILRLVTIGLGASVFVSDAAESGKKKPQLADEFFASTNVPRIRIEIPPDAIEKLSKYQWQFGPQGDRENVNVTVREGNKTYTNVSLHLKGAAGSFRPITDNPAMTLNFDKTVKGQHFHGVEKLSLNNSVQDSTLASEQFGRELFLKAGVPVPRATHAMVELNGRDLGVYVLTEGFNKDFLKKHFKNPDGNLYDGGFLKDVDAELSLNSGENPKDQAGRIALMEAAREKDIQKRHERLDKILDIDRFLTYVAIDTMIWNWDGYPQNKNNWRLYHDPSTGKMVFIPHGLDQLFWKPEGPILPPTQGMVAKAVLQIPELRTQYLSRMKELHGRLFQTEALTNRVRAIAAKVSPLLKEKDPDRAREQETAVTVLCDAIARRARSIEQQLATPIVPLKFDASGVAPLVRWESKTDFGRPVMARQAGEQGEILQLAAKDGSSIGTWRSKVWLEAGRYRVEGRLKTRDIVPDIGDSRGGAGLRVGRGRAESYILGTSDWKNVRHEFSVEDPISEVQVACEFRGAAGEASFDSIRINRLPPKTSEP